MLRSLKRGTLLVLRWLSPRLQYHVVSLYHPIKARFFLRRHPKAVTGGPRIVLVTGEAGPDKVSVYEPVYTVYRTLRPHYDVELSVHASFNRRHALKIVAMRPDLVLLSSDSGEWQRFFEQCHVPIMGSPSRVCRLCYDKAAAKELVKKAGITTMPWSVVRRGQPIAAVLQQVRFPLVVKPRRGGSSEGISKVTSADGLSVAIKKALRWDTEALVEEYAAGKEYTCTVYGNDRPATLPLCRKVMRFERREMKARGERALRTRFPVVSGEPFVARIRELSQQLYVLFGCRDMIRIDWKYDRATEVPCFLEINTLPWIGAMGGNIEECARAAGSSYEDFILKLFADALGHSRST